MYLSVELAKFLASTAPPRGSRVVRERTQQHSHLTSSAWQSSTEDMVTAGSRLCFAVKAGRLMLSGWSAYGDVKG